MPLYVVHRDPQSTVQLSAVVDFDDVWVPQRRRYISLTVEPLPILVVDGECRRKHLQRVTARQPRVLGQIDNAHSPGAELTHDRVTRVNLANSQWHM